MIIDSPRQQDLDLDNWKRMVTLLSEVTPNDAQLILATVGGQETLKAQLLYEFSEKKGALRAADYRGAAAVIRPLAAVSDNRLW